MEGFFQAQCGVLERMVRVGSPCHEILADIVRLIESFGDPGLMCSILLVEDGRIRTGAAPSLPPSYARMLDGLEIGPEEGSCGAAAFSNRIVIVADIATHPNWRRYKDLALPHGLRACWSAPITDDTRVVGTFAMYYREPREPSPRDLELIGHATHLAAIAIVRDREARARRDAEDALRVSEERLRAVIEHTPNVAIQWYDAPGRIVFCNQASRRLFGWEARPVLGHTLHELGFFTADEEARFASARALAASGEAPPPYEFEFRRADGTIGYLFSTVFQIPIHANDPYFVCMDVDLTERRRIEKLVQASEALRATIFASVADPIFCLAVEGEDRYRFLSVNRAFLEATGLREDHVVGKEIADVIPEPSRSLVLGKYRDAIAGRTQLRWEEITPYPTGVKHGEVTVCPIFDDAGRCTTLVGSVHDITAIRNAEAERRELEVRLQQSQRLQSLGTLASGIAHDFNNILAAIVSNTELALEDPAHARDHLGEIQRASQRAVQLVRRILSYGRKQDIRKERTDLRLVVQEASSLVRASIPATVALTTRFSGDVFETLLDPTQIHQVVTNLVINAAQAIGRQRGTIEIAIEPYHHAGSPTLELAEGPYLRLTVTDTGHGMDPATLARAFDPFFTTKPPGEGSGLGLSIVHSIMKHHDGAVTVESSVGRGSRFELYFPLVEPAQVAARPRTERTVMLVDDEEAILFLGKRILGKLGYDVIGHSNAPAALEDFRTRPEQFAAVISDISLPGMSGVALCSEIRSSHPDVALILTSGHVRAEDIEAARALGIDEPILKPHTVDEFAWILSRRLDPHAKP
jgi:PAS domain S-box-containing protein